MLFPHDSRLTLRGMNDQHVIAIATAVQVVLLVANGILVYLYLRATQQIAKMNREQVKVSQLQLEAQIKPALVARLQNDSHVVELVNIGSGPALHVKFVVVPKGSTMWQDVCGLGGYDQIAFLESKQTWLTHVRTRKPDVAGTFILDSSSASLRCDYKSLSGRTYFSVFDFDQSGGFVENTHFGEVD